MGDRHPQPAGEKKDEQGLPIVQVTEKCRTLETLLQFIYPFVNPTITTFEDLSSLTDAAFKYDVTSVLKTVQMLLRECRFMDSQPLRVYAIAKRYSFREVEKDTIKKCYGVNPSKNPSLLTPPEMEYLTARDLHRLLIYRRARADGALNILIKSRTS